MCCLLLRVPPYNTLSRTPADVLTVALRDGAPERCASPATSTAWATNIATDYCTMHGSPPPSPPPSAVRRRLSETAEGAAAIDLRRPLPPRDVVPEIVKWSNISIGVGNWYRIRIPGTQMAMELMLDGVYASSSIELNNDRFPTFKCTDCYPVFHQDDRYTLLFARRYEYTMEVSYASSGCALLLAGFGAYDAIIGQTLGIRQQPALQACPFDVFLWVPKHRPHPRESTVCPSGFGILAGSSSMDAVRSLFIRETVCALEYPFQNGHFDPYWDGSYPPSPPVHPDAGGDSALPGEGRDTTTNTPCDPLCVEGANCCPETADPEPEPTGDFCNELTCSVLVLGLPDGKTLPDVAWTTVAVLVEFLLGIRQNLPPDYPRATEWEQVEVIKGVDFQYTNPLVNGCAGATSSNPRLATDGSCKARYFNVTIKTKWQSELTGSLTTPNTLSNSATSIISAFKSVDETTIRQLVTQAVTIAGENTGTADCDNPASLNVCMSTWWTGPFVYEVPSVQTRSIYGNPPTPPHPPPGSVEEDDDMSWLTILWICMASVAVVAVGAGFACAYVRSGDKEATGMAKKDESGNSGQSAFAAWPAALSTVYAAPAFGMSSYHGLLERRHQEAQETTPLRFDLGSVLTR